MSVAVLRRHIAAAGSAAERFGHRLRRPGGVAIPKPPRACALQIVRGLHEGALLRSRTSPMRIGSAEDDDVQLHDPGILPHHAELRRVDGAWALFVAGGAEAAAPAEQWRRAACTRAVYRLGAAELVLSQCLPLPPAPAAQSQARQRLLATGLFVLAAALGAGVIVQLIRPAAARVVPGERGLGQHGWPDVRIVVDAQRRRHLQGHVPDPAALASLQAWLKERGLAGLPSTVRVGSELVQRVQDALGDADLAVTWHPGGVVRVQGSSSRLELRGDLQRLAADLKGVVVLEDRVTYVETPELPRFRPLPFRIVNVLPGEHGSFITDTGGRFFVGAVLPDGAQVLAIHADGVEFRLGERTVRYPLK